MKSITTFAVSLLLTAALLTPAFAQGTTRVRGHVRKDGTVVQPHVRTKPNKTENDNYSTKGNTNPQTGKKGTKTPRR